MATVFLAELLQPYTGSSRLELEMNVASYREMVTQLESRFPGIAAKLEADMAVAIDGEIIHEPLLEAIGENSEVHFLKRLAGG